MGDSSTSNGSEDSQPGQRHRLLVILAALTGVVTLTAAIIGLVNTIVDGSEGGSAQVGSAPAKGATTVREPAESEPPAAGGGEQGARGSERRAPDPSRNGNSRSTAKRLQANREIESSLVAANDMDWYVYEARKPETATVEFTEGDTGEGYGGVVVIVSEGLKEVTSSHVDLSETYKLSRLVSPGTSIYVTVKDGCGIGTGCGVGPYSLVVSTGPAG